MLRTLLHVVLQVGITVARIAIMVAVAALTLAGRLMAAAVGALWRRQLASPSRARTSAPISPAPRPLAPEPRVRAHRPRPFKF